MKKLFTTILVIALASYGYGQSLKSGFDNLRNNKPDAAAKIFSKALDKRTETLAASYGLGCVLCHPNYSGYNAVKGFRLIRNAYDSFVMTSAKTKAICRDTYKFTYNDIANKMSEVAQQQLDAVILKNTVEDYQWFLDTFDGAEAQTMEAKIKQSELVWQTTKQANTFRAYQDFYNNFPNTPHAQEAADNFKDEWMKMCREAFSEGELSSMEDFKEKYPKYPFYTETEKQEYILAQMGYKLKMNLRYLQDYEPYYKEYIEKAAPCQLAFVALQRMASPLLEMGRYAEAADLFASYKSKFPDMASDIDEIANMLRQPGNKYKSTPMPEAINTEHFEYAPVMTPDGNTLYFCGNNRPDNIGNEDIFVSYKIDGKWQDAQNLKQFNTALGNEAPLAVSPDGNMLLIYKDSNIFYTERKGNGWTQLKKMDALNTGKTWEADASFTPDGNAILFISDRSGNIGRYHPHEQYFHGCFHGNSDIYVSTRNSNGTWNEPINLGAIINTPYSERSPWLASDMKTLYFSSDGHAGMGQLDVFKATRLSDTSWTQWSKPINLGKEINTANDDYNYVISTNGESAYFTKVTQSNVDICTVKLPEKMRPEAIGIVFGKVTDNNNNKLAASIKWEDLQNGKTLGNLKCDPTTGQYFITLPAGRNYGYFVEMDGYYPVSGNLNTENLKSGTNIERNIVMNSINDIMEGKVSIVLENIFFDTNKFELKPESYPELSRLAKFINENPTAVLEISGHTDNSGSADFNNNLSQMRANSVRDYLISKGCQDNRLISKGYGSQKPIDSNTTDQGKAKNRRVEFRIIK